MKKSGNISLIIFSVCMVSFMIKGSGLFSHLQETYAFVPYGEKKSSRELRFMKKKPLTSYHAH